jgi:hypothetical protein
MVYARLNFNAIIASVEKMDCFAALAMTRLIG